MLVTVLGSDIDGMITGETPAFGATTISDNSLAACREFLKDTIRQKIDFSQSNQNQGVPPPPLENPYPSDAVRIKLLPAGQWQGVELVDLASAIEERLGSRRWRAAGQDQGRHRIVISWNDHVRKAEIAHSHSLYESAYFRVDGGDQIGKKRPLVRFE